MPCTVNTDYANRAWNLRTGDIFRGRTIIDIWGVVGLACNPVVVISFSKDGRSMARVPAAYIEGREHGDDVMVHARHWIRSHGLHEGDTVDLNRLRSSVMESVMA